MCDDPIKPRPSGKLLDAETWDALRKAGVPEAELEPDQPFGPIIYPCTRGKKGVGEKGGRGKKGDGALYSTKGHSRNVTGEVRTVPAGH